MLTNEQRKYIRQNVDKCTKKQIAKEANATYGQVLRYCQYLHKIGIGTRQKHTKWTHGQNEILIAIFSEPLSWSEKIDKVSRETGHPIGSIPTQYKTLRKLGMIESRRKFKHDDIKDELIRDYKKLVKMNVMVKKYKMSAGAIRQFAHKAGAYREGYFKNV